MSEARQKTALFPRLTKIVLPMVILAIGGVAWAYFKATAPTIERKPPQRQVAIVEVQPAVIGDAVTKVSVMGTVVPSLEVTLKARVAGEIASVAPQFVPGGHLAKGAELLALDPSDLQIQVQKAGSALDDARATLAIEQGSQAIAREELKLLAEMSPDAVVESDLALRKPQLQQARAAVAGAEADLRKAQLDLARAKVKAPFNALIIERHVNLGAYVGVQESLATVVDTDVFWIEAVVPLNKMALIDFNREGGCPAVVRSQAGNGRWDARVVRVAGKLNEESRMATVILAVEDPLGLIFDNHGSPLMIDDYVYVDIAGRPLNDVIALPRSVLRDDNTVWIYDNDTLDVRKVTLAGTRGEAIYIRDGIASGEQVIVSQLSTPVQGMPLKMVNDDRKAIAGNADGRGDSQ